MVIKSLALNMITHNGAQSFIKEAINSVRDYCSEFVIVDDGSTDDTRFLIKVEFPEAKIIRFEKSHSTERAMLLNTAKAETGANWILRIDDDEIMPQETMEEILSLDDSVPSYTIPFLHYENNGFIDPNAHKRNSFYVARLYKNIPEINWTKTQEVISYNRTLISSKGNQIKLCKKLNNPFLHFGGLVYPEKEYAYDGHFKGHCWAAFQQYERYIPKKN